WLPPLAYQSSFHRRGVGGGKQSCLAAAISLPVIIPPTRGRWGDAATFRYLLVHVHELVRVEEHMAEIYQRRRHCRINFRRETGRKSCRLLFIKLLFDDRRLLLQKRKRQLPLIGRRSAKIGEAISSRYLQIHTRSRLFQHAASKCLRRSQKDFVVK